MSHRLLFRLGLSLLALLAPLAGAQTVSQIRLMLHPDAAAPGALPADALARLQALAGVPLALSGTTRTGGLEFSLPSALSTADAAAMLRRLREDRSVLWAESVRPQAQTVGRPGVLANKLMVRLAGDPMPDWATLLPRWSALAGSPLAVESQSGGNVWVLSAFSAVPEDRLAQMASQLQADPAVQYADAVTHAYAQLVPNDPFFPLQWALQDPRGGINAPAAWDLTIGSASVVIAVVDTGITQHPELAGRILPGYDFITDPLMANDGDGRDPDPSDPGDWVGDNDCGDGIARPSSFHGTFVSGIIAANSNNGVGIAGINWVAKILPIRVLGRCGGTFDDIRAGLLWAVGAPVPGVPPNPNPARVINMSLGGISSCPQALQDAVDTALSYGAIIVVASGNQGQDATTSAPANCSGVITVGASTIAGERASYSNFGQRVDVSAPGGDGEDVSGWVLSIGNDGERGPGNPIFEYAIGTSAAAPQVAGAASLILARNSTLTPGRVQDLITGAARPFLAGNSCGTAGVLCGDGILDIGLALQSTLPGVAPPPGTVTVIEYYRQDLDHYFMTADPAEAAFVDAVLVGVFARTGEIFYAWANPALAPPGAVPVCRFYSPVFNSHYFTADAFECQFIIVHWPGVWNLETAAAFYTVVPDVNGNCPAGMLPVYKFFDGRQDANQRHTIDLSVQRAMINRAWIPQGFGPRHVAMCSAI